jgi:NhaP-type Na+/H+ or K+/H+ antiporter
VDGRTPGQEIISSTGSFILIFVGSVLIGAVTGLLIAFVLKRQSSHHVDEEKLQKLIYEEQNTAGDKDDEEER